MTLHRRRPPDVTGWEWRSIAMWPTLEQAEADANRIGNAHVRVVSDRSFWTVPNEISPETVGKAIRALHIQATEAEPKGRG